MPRYIDANALQKRLQDFSDWCRDGRKQGVDFVLDCPLPDIPTADVQKVKHGTWKTYFGGEELMCSCCKTTFYDADKSGGTNYCPECGVKMMKG